MMKKIVLVTMLLVLICSTAFAASGVTTQNPTSGQTVVGDRTFLIDMNLTDSNSGLNTGSPDVLRIYYSTTPGTYQNLILYDANIQDASRVNCAKDYNLWTSTDCNYSWTIPNFLTVPMGDYYIDYNFGVFDANKYTWYTASSDRFIITQPMPTASASMIALALFIAAAGLAVVFVFRMGKGDATVNELIPTAIAIIVLLIVGWTIYGIAVVPI